MDAIFAPPAFVKSFSIYSLRPTQPTDEGDLLRIYASTRSEEMALVSWTDAQKEAFLRMQFDAQASHYLLHYPTAEYYIILHEGHSIGRLILECSA